MRLALMQLALVLCVLTPLALDHDYHLGRKFLMSSPYLLPTDLSEDGRLDAQHRLMTLLLAGLFLAPLRSPQAMLDVACGTGLWCQEMAEQFPDAQITGLDMSEGRIAMLTTRTLHRHRPNLHWRCADALEPLPFEDNSFDYVHLRFGATFIPEKRWPFVVDELARVTRPGGWVELLEGKLPESAHLGYQYLCARLAAVVAARGLDGQSAAHLSERLRRAGLVAVQEQKYVTGTTPEEQRLLFQTTVVGFRNLLPLLKKHLPPRTYTTYLHALTVVEQEQPKVSRTDIVAWAQKPGKEA